MKWEWKIESGSKLREAIDNFDGDTIKVAKQLLVVWEDIAKHQGIPLKSSTYPIRKKIKEGHATQDFIDKRLAELYDYCDAWRFFVAL